MKLLALWMLLSVVFPMAQVVQVQVAIRKIETYVVASTYTFENITNYAQTLVDNLIDLMYVTLKLLFVIIVMSFTVIPVLRIIRRVRSR